MDAIREGVVRSKAQMSRLENGHRTQLTLANINGLCDLYGVRGQDKYIIQQMHLKAEADEEWWEPHTGVMFTNIEMLFSLERLASRTYIFSELIHGLFQTKGHTEMMHWHLEPDEAKWKVELRMQRQADFWSLDPLPEVRLMMPESALLGRCDQEQIDHLVERGQLPSISIRYLPLADSPYPRLNGAFTVLTFEGEEPDVVYTATASTARYEEREAALEAYLTRFASHFEEQARPIKEFRRG